MTTIADATGYTDQDNGQEVEGGHPLLNAPKSGASPKTKSKSIPGPANLYPNLPCPHCDEGQEFHLCTCLPIS